MKNYYKLLEVDRNASKEMIDKAFRVLAKKYHPDVQEESKKAWAESKFKEINEAYEILSNESKRKDYDINFQEIEELQYQKLTKQNEQLQNLVNQLQNKVSTDDSDVPQPDATSSWQNNPYVRYYNTIHYEEPAIKTKKTVRERCHDIISIIITFVIIFIMGFLLWKIPFTKQFLLQLYEENAPIKIIVDIILSIFVN